MTLSITITFSDGHKGAMPAAWAAWAGQHGLEPGGPAVLYRHSYYDRAGDVRLEVSSSRRPQRAVFSTNHVGTGDFSVAAHALAAWAEFGGVLEASPELRRLICQEFGTVTFKDS
jgi:hypothetical protein